MIKKKNGFFFLRNGVTYLFSDGTYIVYVFLDSCDVLLVHVDTLDRHTYLRRPSLPNSCSGLDLSLGPLVSFVH